MAESVFKEKVNQAGLASRFQVDSAGTAGYHIGEWPDNRTIATLNGHGIDYYSKARQLQKTDLEEYDFIMAMDHSNYADILMLKDGDSKSKIEMFRDYDSTKGDLVVPDPYYGSMNDFKNVYDIVERCSANLLEAII
ncbi:MAG: low molecular weight phosphotyrosine protein phosphatase [Bacteroidia bacterium]